MIALYPRFTKPIAPIPVVSTSYIIDRFLTSSQKTKLFGRWNGTITDGFDQGVYTGSKTEKQRLTDYKDAFIANTTDWRWTTLPTLDGTGKIPKTNTTSYYNGYKVRRLKGAATWAYMNADTALMATIRDELIAQAGIYTTNMSNPIWVQERYQDDNIMFEAGEFYAMMAWAFIMCEQVFSITQKETVIDNYLVPSVTFLVNEVNLSLVNYLTGRDVSLNTSPADYTVKNISGTLTEYNYRTAGNVQTNANSRLARAVNNRRASMLSSALVLYLITNNTYFKNSCVMFAKDHLAWTWWEDGSNAEFQRTKGATANKGLGYTSISLGFSCMVANMLYRKDGDTSLFSYTTKVGNSGSASVTIDKALLWAVKEYHKYYDGTYDRYCQELPVATDNKLDGKLASGEVVLSDATYCAVPLLNYYLADATLLALASRSDIPNVAHTSNYADVWLGDEKGQNNGRFLEACGFIPSAFMWMWNNN